MDRESGYSLNERSRNGSESSIGSKKEYNWSYFYNSEENGNEDDSNNKSANDLGVEAEDDQSNKSASGWGAEDEDGWGIEKNN